MARPRKNRTGEYARLLGEEISLQLQRVVRSALADAEKSYKADLAELQGELKRLGRRVESLARRVRTHRPSLGRWVPGGPGRPPKDAAARIAAFETREKKPKAERSITRRRPKRTTED
jgi:hypothetical protein